MSNQSDLAKSAAGFNGDPLSIDTANNRVGIGTTSVPAEARAMVSGGRFYVNSQDQYSVLLQNGGTSGGFIGTTGVDTINFFRSNGTEHMKIDASGRVTMPYQPAFDVGLTSGAVGATNVVLFNNVRLNRGSHYSSSTGRFTAPIAGLYQFYWGGIKNAITSVTRAVLRRNGTSVRENRLAEGIDYTNACWTMLIDLSASDYVDIQITTGSFYGSTDFYGNAFGGYLIG